MNNGGNLEAPVATPLNELPNRVRKLLQKCMDTIAAKRETIWSDLERSAPATDTYIRTRLPTVNLFIEFGFKGAQGLADGLGASIGIFALRDRFITSGKSEHLNFVT